MKFEDLEVKTAMESMKQCMVYRKPAQGVHCIHKSVTRTRVVFRVCCVLVYGSMTSFSASALAFCPSRDT